MFMSNTGGKIFIVEDDPLLVNLYSNAFRSFGYEVETDFNGEDGLKKLTDMKKKPTVVLSDVMMPKMHGLDLLAKIKENPDLKKIPVILLTNLGKEEDIKRGLELGAVTYLVKSEYTPREIVGKVREILAGYARDAVPEVKVKVKDLGSK